MPSASDDELAKLAAEIHVMLRVAADHGRPTTALDLAHLILSSEWLANHDERVRAVDRAERQSERITEVLAETESAATDAAAAIQAWRRSREGH